MARHDPGRLMSFVQGPRFAPTIAVAFSALMMLLLTGGCTGSSQPASVETTEAPWVDQAPDPVSAPRIGSAPDALAPPVQPDESELTDASDDTSPRTPLPTPAPTPAATADASSPLAPGLPGPSSDMLVGFHDDRTFLYLDGRDASLDHAASLGANLLRTYVVWEQVAASRPTNASDPNDPAYDWSYHDALVRAAHQRGVLVLMTIWATPGWANAGDGDSTAPSDLQDLVDFAFALARRYSGEFEDIPAVQLYSFWNEPNLNRFLSPQFDEDGRSVSPATYAAMYRAAHLGLTAANPNARVAFLEVSPRGRDRPGERPTRDSHSPGRFAELVAQACDGSCEFDAIAWHPYSPSLAGKPSGKVRWPNANLPELERFSRSLMKWFDRPSPPRIWITEYGHQTDPPRPGAVTLDEQADYLEEAISISRASGLVDMFVWFIFQDDPTSLPNRWEAAGGLIDRDAVPKPSFKRLREVLDEAS